MEVSFDGGLNYSDSVTHTFTEKGVKNIKIRFKETQTATAGEPFIVKFNYSDFYSGDGREDTPYIIDSAKDLLGPAETVNEGLNDALRIGGIAGYNSGSIISCENRAVINTDLSTVIGGIAGANSGVVVKCVNNGSVFTQSSIVGGIEGLNMDAAAGQHDTVTAFWQIIEYNINYDLGGQAVNNNPNRYTVEDELVLSEPESEGYIFLYRTDSESNIMDTVSAGTAGNLSLTAHREPVTVNPPEPEPDIEL